MNGMRNGTRLEYANSQGRPAVGSWAVGSWARWSLLVLLGGGIVGLSPACRTAECFTTADCADGSTCCAGACTGLAPIPIGPSDCVAGCECEEFSLGDDVRSICFFYEGTGTNQCSRPCGSAGDCISSEGIQGECVLSVDVVGIAGLCAWGAP